MTIILRMDFIIYILESIFQKSPSEAVSIMLEVHKKGSGVYGTFSREGRSKSWDGT